MGSIGEIVRHALRSRYLSLEAENQLRRLLARGCNLEEIRAFVQLQAAVVDGLVTQESRERLAKQAAQRELAALS